MDTIIEGLAQAIKLVAGGNPALYDIILLSLQVTGVSLSLSTVLGIPVGAWLGLNRFCGRRLVMALLYTGMGFPPVVVGLFVYLLLSRSGPLGGLGWLFTPRAMVVSQIIISFPLIAGFTMAAVMAVDRELRQQLLSLGATPRQATRAILVEARVGVAASVVAGFGSIVSEVGSVMMVGGNIEGRTRVLTTAIVLETRKGDFGLALALGIVLLSLAFFANLLAVLLQGGFGVSAPERP